MPDIVVGGPRPKCIEFKCYTWAAPSGTAGRGTAATGGRPSTEDGHVIAFGGTEESLRHKNLGLKQRGDPSDRPFKRDTGRGYVAPSDGDYTDALSKQHPVTLAITETSGAITDSLASFLHILARTARAEGRHRQHEIRPQPRLDHLLLRPSPLRDLHRRPSCRRQHDHQRRYA